MSMLSFFVIVLIVSPVFVWLMSLVPPSGCAGCGAAMIPGKGPACWFLPGYHEHRIAKGWAPKHRVRDFLRRLKPRPLGSGDGNHVGTSE